MKVCHVIIVCSLTALLTILDLPLGSCDDVILQKRVSTDGSKETLIRPVITICISVDRTTGGIFQRKLHPHS